MVKYSKLRINRISKISRKNKIVTKKYNKIKSIKQVKQTNKITKKQSGGDAGGMGGHAGDVISGCKLHIDTNGEVQLYKNDSIIPGFVRFWVTEEGDPQASPTPYGAPTNYYNPLKLKAVKKHPEEERDESTIFSNKTLENIFPSQNDPNSLNEVFKEGTNVILKVVKRSVKDTKPINSHDHVIDREFRFREWIVNQMREPEEESHQIQVEGTTKTAELSREQIEPYYKLMIKHIPGVLVEIKGEEEGKKGKNSKINGKKSKNEITHRLYMIQESVVQEDSGFVFDFKIGAQTAFMCDKGKEQKRVNKVLSASNAQGWRMESLFSIDGPGESALNNTKKQFQKINSEKRKDHCKSGLLKSAAETLAKFMSQRRWLKYSQKYEEYIKKAKWYKCNAKFLRESLQYLLSKNTNYVLNIKLGDFGHPFYQGNTHSDFSIYNTNCNKDDVTSIIANFNKGLQAFTTNLNSVYLNSVDLKNKSEIKEYTNLVKLIKTSEKLGFVGSSIMLGVYEKKPTESEVEEPSAPVEESPAESHYQKAPSYEDRYGTAAARAAPAPAPAPAAPLSRAVSAQDSEFKDLVLNQGQIEKIKKLIKELKAIQ
jgi:hypothetical protein